MKYTYKLIKQFNPDGSIWKWFRISLTPIGIESKISYVLASPKHLHLPYYIQEIKKLINNQRTKPLEIGTNEDINFEYDIPYDCIIVEKDWAYHPEEIKKYPEKKLETTELLEFLQIMTKELGID